MKLQTSAIRIVGITFPSGARDFLLVHAPQGNCVTMLHPLELLGLDQTAQLIEKVGRKQPSLALVLALCRLLVPCLKYHGSGRHIVVEPWSLDDIKGETLTGDVHTQFARELSSEQTNDFEVITTGERPPEGSLAELYWRSQTALPSLPSQFEDEDLAGMAKALYLHLISEGKGMVEVDVSAITRAVDACRAGGFASLQLGSSSRKLQQAFRKLLAVTVRYASQVVGQIANDLISHRLQQEGHKPLSEAENELIALRYGACRALCDINVGFVFGCGPIQAGLINDYYHTLAEVQSGADKAEAEEVLRAFVYLLGKFQERRRSARAQERREIRHQHGDRLPGGRQQAEYQEDRSVPAPETAAMLNEEMEILQEMLPLLKMRNAARLRAFIDCNGDRKAAAEMLGVEPLAYSQQLRQTVFPAVRKLARDQAEQE